MRLWLGIFPLALALALAALPVWRITQGRLTLRGALGLWISAAGFGLLALAAFALEGADLQTAVWSGVVLLAVGNLVQRRLTRHV
jgi:hypothetical protein